MDKKSECFAPYFLLQIRALSSLFVTPVHPTFSQTQYQPALSSGSDQGLIVTSVDALIELEGNFRGGGTPKTNWSGQGIGDKPR